MNLQSGPPDTPPITRGERNILPKPSVKIFQRSDTHSGNLAPHAMLRMCSSIQSGSEWILVLENYTFLTITGSSLGPNVHTGTREQILGGYF